MPDGGEEGNRAEAGGGEGPRGGNRPPEEDQPAAQVPAGGDPAQEIKFAALQRQLGSGAGSLPY